MASTELTALETAWKACIADIDIEQDNGLLKAKADHTLTRYVKAMTRHEDLEEGILDSYTIAGRTFTRRNITEGQDAIDRLEGELRQLCYGSTSLVDMNIPSQRR